MIALSVAIRQALQIREVLHLVFTFVRDGSSSTISANAFVLSCLLCCKSWVEPAKDVLWEELPSILPLLKILPAVCQMSRAAEDGSTMHFPSEYSWVRALIPAS
jgi:hypothetical protein